MRRRGKAHGVLPALSAYYGVNKRSVMAKRDFPGKPEIEAAVKSVIDK